MDPYGSQELYPTTHLHARFTSSAVGPESVEFGVKDLSVLN